MHLVRLLRVCVFDVETDWDWEGCTSDFINVFLCDNMRLLTAGYLCVHLLQQAALPEQASYLVAFWDQARG